MTSFDVSSSRPARVPSAPAGRAARFGGRFVLAAVGLLALATASGCHRRRHGGQGDGQSAQSAPNDDPNQAGRHGDHRRAHRHHGEHDRDDPSRGPWTPQN